MADLVWIDAFEIGVDFIDDDHKKLLAIMQSIKAAIESHNMNKCTQLLNQLLSEAQQHFQREEEFLQQARFPNLAEHKQYHQLLLQKADTTRKICQGIETDHDLRECFDGMANFLIDDILRGDINFKSYLEYEGFIKNR